MQYFTKYQAMSILTLAGPMDDLVLDGPEWEETCYFHQN